MSNHNMTYVPAWLYETQRDQYGWPIGLTKEEQEKLTACMRELLQTKGSATMLYAVEVAKTIGNGEFRRFNEPYLYACVDRAMREADASPGWCIRPVAGSK
jgi:hypothetical protein